MKHDLLGGSLRDMLAAEESTRAALAQINSLDGALDAFKKQEQMLGLGSATKMAPEQQEQWRKLLRPFDHDTLGAYAQLARVAAGPLMKSRAEILFESEISKIAASHKATLSALPNIGALGALDDSIGAAMRRLSGLTDTVATQMASTLGSTTKSQLEAFASSLGSIGGRLSRELGGVGALRDMFDAGQWARSLGAPMLDAASIASVARAWGADGALRNIRELGGIDAATLRMIAEAIDATEYDEGAEPAPSPQRGALSLDTLLAIFSILLAIAMFQWQKEDSDAAEARAVARQDVVVAEIRSADERSAERVEKLARAFEAAVAQMQAQSTPARYVVRSRGALIYRSKGGAVVAEAIPGQVVTLIAREGKWIEVSYFDFSQGKQRAGWAMKKYLARLEPNQPEVASQAEEE